MLLWLSVYLKQVLIAKNDIYHSAALFLFEAIIVKAIGLSCRVDLEITLLVICILWDYKNKQFEIQYEIES